MTRPTDTEIHAALDAQGGWEWGWEDDGNIEWKPPSMRFKCDAVKLEAAICRQEALIEEAIKSGRYNK